MTYRVVDASVVAAAFFQEAHSEPARELLADKDPLFAPDLIYPELANVIWKRLGRNEIGADEAALLLKDFMALPLRITPSSELVEIALRLAIETRRTVYDCLYLALAIKNKTAMVTGDHRFANALAATPLASHVLWIGELP